MAAVVKPRLLIGCGDSGWEIVKRCKEEYLLQYPELGEKDHDTAICLHLIPQDHNHISGRRQVEDLYGEIFSLDNGIQDSLEKLFQDEDDLLSKNAKKRFETEEKEGGLRRIHIHVVADVASEYGESFCVNDWPALQEAILRFKGVASGLAIYVSLFLMVGTYDDNENERQGCITTRLSQVKYISEKWNLPRPKIYFVDRWATDMTLLAETDLKDIVTAFLESLLIPKYTSDSEDYVDFLWIVDREEPYSSFGVRMVGLPTVEISKYACNQGIIKAIDYFLSDSKESFHGTSTTDPSDQEEFSAINLVRPNSPKISKRLIKRGIAALDTAINDWKTEMNDWAYKTSAAVKAPNYDCGKIYEAKVDELTKDLKNAFDTIPGCLRRAKSTLEHWRKICKSASKAIKKVVSPEIRFDPADLCSKDKEALEAYKDFKASKQKLRKALQKYPDSGPVILFFTLCTMLMAFFLTLMIWPLTTLTLTLSIGIGGPVTLNMLLVAFTLYIPTNHLSKCRDDFQEDMDHYGNVLQKRWEKKLQQVHHQHQESIKNLAYHLVGRKVRHYTKKIEIFEKILRDRRHNCREQCKQLENIGKKLANGEEPKDRCLRITKARNYILDEQHFNEFYLAHFDWRQKEQLPDRLSALEYSSSKVDQNSVFDSFYKDIFDSFSYEAYLKIEQIVRNVTAGIFYENDFTEIDTTLGIKKELKEKSYKTERNVLVQVNRSLVGKGMEDSLIVSAKDHIPSVKVEELDGCSKIIIRKSVDPHKVYIYRVKRGISNDDFAKLTS